MTEGLIGMMGPDKPHRPRISSVADRGASLLFAGFFNLVAAASGVGQSIATKLSSGHPQPVPTESIGRVDEPLTGEGCDVAIPGQQLFLGGRGGSSGNMRLRETAAVGLAAVVGPAIIGGTKIRKLYRSTPSLVRKVADAAKPHLPTIHRPQ